MFDDIIVIPEKWTLQYKWFKELDCSSITEFLKFFDIPQLFSIAVGDQTINLNNVSFCHGLDGLFYLCNDLYNMEFAEACVATLEKNYFNNEVLSEYSEWGVLDGKFGIAFVEIALKFRKRMLEKKFLE